MKRYLTIVGEDNEVLASIDLKTDKTFFRGDIRVLEDDYEEILEERNGKICFVGNDH